MDNRQLSADTPLDRIQNLRIQKHKANPAVYNTSYSNNPGKEPGQNTMDRRESKRILPTGHKQKDTKAFDENSHLKNSARSPAHNIAHQYNTQTITHPRIGNTILAKDHPIYMGKKKEGK